VPVTGDEPEIRPVEESVSPEPESEPVASEYVGVGVPV
jgi:hypothetical protein